MSEGDINIIENFLNYNKEYLSVIEIASISRLLKAYRVQQKEIEEKTTIIMAGAEKVKQLEKEIQRLEKDNDTLSELVIVNEDKVIKELDLISKDKIREKIEHYNNELEHIKNGEEFENEKPMYYWGKVALENLLEENQMSDEEIIEYCRKLVQANLSQYTDTNLNALNEYIELSDKNNKKALLKHCLGIKTLLEKCIDLLEEK